MTQFLINRWVQFALLSVLLLGFVYHSGSTSRWRLEMQGLVFDRPVGEYIQKALERGLILINAGTDIIRFVPPLIISRQDVDAMIRILEDCLQ